MLKTWIQNKWRRKQVTAAATAYDLWADSYDHQPGNLMLDLDAVIFDEMTKGLLQGKSIADIGCGTGRHWDKIWKQQPASVTGVDVSAGMLLRLRTKYPDAVTYLATSDALPLATQGFDVIISTLTIAHIADIENAFGEWNRIIQRGGMILLTDYHPAALAKGGKRTFANGDRLITIKNYVHPVQHIRKLITKLGWSEIRYTERIVGETVRHYYENKNAIKLYDKYKGIPIIYGMLLKKDNDPA